MKIGLYFGSFNPIHIGHLIVANSILETATLDEIWFVISPQSPFKTKHELADANHRSKMVELAVYDHPKISASTIEFDLPYPSYTVNTLEALVEKHPKYDFSILMGTDNIIHFEKWKAYMRILELVNILVYNRSTDEIIPKKWLEHDKVSIFELPLINVSSTFLRAKVNQGKSIKYWLPKEVEAYILKEKLYQ